MWVGLVQSVEGLNRLKCPASRKNKEVLQQIIIRLHLHHQLSWLPTLPGSPHCRFGPVSLHNHESIPYNKSLSLHMYILLIFSGVVQLLSHVRIFATRWTAVCQASLSFTISWSLFKFTSTESVMLSNHFILCHYPSSSFAFNSSQH